MVHAVCEFYKRDLNPCLGAPAHMMDDGVHAIDTLRWMCGGEVVDIHSVTKRVQAPDINFISASLRFDNGALGVMLLSWTSGRRIFRVQMHAPAICAEAEHEGKGRLYADGDTKGVEYDTQAVAGSDQIWVYGGFQAKHREFIDALKTKTAAGLELRGRGEDDGSGGEDFGAGAVGRRVMQAYNVARHEWVSVDAGFLIVRTFARLYNYYRSRYNSTRDWYGIPRIDREPSHSAIQYRGLDRDALDD